MNRFGLSLHGIGLLGLACCAGMAHAQDRAPTVADFGMPVSMERLDAVRGGFDLGDGLQASLGIQRAIYVDGNLVTYINVSIPDIAHITTQQAMSLATALGTLDVQVGQGNTFNSSSSTAQASAATVTQSALSNVTSHVAASTAPATQANTVTVVQNALSSPMVTSTIIPASTPAQASAATVIQNTVDNQVIRSLTTLNVAISALNAMRNQGLQQSLQSAQQLQALAH